LYTLLKSEVGPFPEPHFPTGIDLKAEDAKARRRLYPVTIFYSLQFLILLGFAVRAGHALAALACVALGLAAWVPVEYLVHRYLLHGVFPKEGGPIALGLHYLFDSSHSDHHARPWDGMYINAHMDTLFAAAVFVPLSFLAPYYTLPVFVATLLVCYAAEEWVHHATHFWNFRWSYFQYLRRRHLYHHTRHGSSLAYGVTSGVWDAVSRTRIPDRERRRLLPWRAAPTAGATAASAPPEDLFA
jgi:sterol desaturase/sphingolipid hydroxylase (fatty acid hydroxylase superfamily)